MGKMENVSAIDSGKLDDALDETRVRQSFTTFLSSFFFLSLSDK